LKNLSASPDLDCELDEKDLNDIELFIKKYNNSAQIT
jgi:hypothetical protein